MDTANKKILRKSNLFQGIDDHKCYHLINCLRPQKKHYSKNEIIILTGDSVNHIGIILSGDACAYKEDIHGNQNVMSYFQPIATFGEILASTTTHKSPVTVYAMSDVTAAFIDYHKIYSVCTEACISHKTFIQNIHRSIGDKYFNLFDRINILKEKTLRAKIMAYLYVLSGRKEVSVVTLPFSKTILADYLLVNRSALSRELGKMESDGLVSINGREIEVRQSFN